MKTILFSIAILIPVVVYIFSLFKEGKAGSLDTFFLPKNSLNHFEFANSSIAYNFSISTVVIAMAWGFNASFISLINPLAWGLGIVLFTFLLSRVLKTVIHGETIHGYLARHYNMKSIGYITALVSLLSFIGMALAELAVGVSILSNVLTSPTTALLVISIIALAVSSYVHIVGQHAALRTDQIQLAFAYTAIFAVLGSFWIWVSKTSSVGAVFVIMAVVLLVILYLLSKQKSHVQGLFQVWIRRILFSGVILSFIVLISSGFHGSLPEIKIIPGLFQNTLFVKWDFIAILVLPFVWQFVDTNMWQRISSFEKSHDDEKTLKSLKKSFLRFALESPLTWVYAVCAGMLLRYTSIGVDGNSIWNLGGVFPGLIYGLGALGIVVAFLFTLASFATMFSTFDSMFISALFVINKDVIHEEKESNFVSKKVAWLGYGFTLLILALLWIQQIKGINFAVFLFGAYGVLVTMFPPVLGVLFPKFKANKYVTFLSITSGMLAGLYVTYLATSDFSLTNIPPLVAIVVSSIVYLLGTLLFKKDKILGVI